MIRYSFGQNHRCRAKSSLICSLSRCCSRPVRGIDPIVLIRCSFSHESLCCTNTYILMGIILLASIILLVSVPCSYVHLIISFMLVCLDAIESSGKEFTPRVSSNILTLKSPVHNCHQLFSLQILIASFTLLETLMSLSLIHFICSGTAPHVEHVFHGNYS